MKHTLQNLLAAGKIKQTIEQALLLNTADKDWHNRILLISARFKEYEKQQLGGLESPSFLGIELHKINTALLAAIDELPEDAPEISPTSKPTIIQNAEKIYNIDHIDNANFS